MLLGKAMCTRLNQPVRIDRNSRNYLLLYHEKFTGTDDSTTPESGDAHMLSAEEIHQKGSSPCSYHLPYHLLLLSSSFSLLLFFEVHTNYCIWILILILIWNPFFFQISTCQHSASIFRPLRLWPPPSVLRRWHGVCHVPYWVRGHCHGHLKNSEKKGGASTMDAEKKHELQGKQNFTPYENPTSNKQKNTKQKCSTSEKHHRTGGIVKGSGTPSCFGFRWQVRVAQAWNSPLMGGFFAAWSFLESTKAYVIPDLSTFQRGNMWHLKNL